mgnify:CR=1 FL=1
MMCVYVAAVKNIKNVAHSNYIHPDESKAHKKAADYIKQPAAFLFLFLQ